jgi:hypothetical protein
MARWEYLDVRVRQIEWREGTGESGEFLEVEGFPYAGTDLTALLNQIGRRRWELTSTLGGPGSFTLIFKRPRASPFSVILDRWARL